MIVATFEDRQTRKGLLFGVKYARSRSSFEAPDLFKKKKKKKKKIYIYIYIYIYILCGRKRQINYNFIPTSLFRGRPLIRGFNENKRAMVKFILIKSPDEWATTKQACRDELVVYLSFFSTYTTLYFYVLSTVLRKSSFTLYIYIYIYYLRRYNKETKISVITVT